jgi:hypothetical protein
MARRVIDFRLSAVGGRHDGKKHKVQKKQATGFRFLVGVEGIWPLFASRQRSGRC